MFINDQYTFNQSLNWPYQDAMESYYYGSNMWDGDHLYVLIFGA